MKKTYFTLMALMLALASYSQTRIRIGETVRNIASFYKEKGYDVNYFTQQTDNGEVSKLKLNSKDFVITYEYDPRTNLCYSQSYLFKNKKAFQDTCDDLKIRYDYDTYYPIIEKKKYEIKSYQVKVDDGHRVADKIIVYGR